MVKCVTYPLALLAMSAFSAIAGAGWDSLTPLWAFLGAGCMVALGLLLGNHLKKTKDKLASSSERAEMTRKGSAKRDRTMLARLMKYAIGLFYLIGGPLIHGYLITQQRELYVAVDDTAWPVYQQLWTRLVLPNLTPLVALLVLFEMVAGALMLSKQRRLAQLGQIAGLLFNLLLAPFWFFYAIPNLLLAAVHLWLALSNDSTPRRVLRTAWQGDKAP
jgi:hypothetical protein